MTFTKNAESVSLEDADTEGMLLPAAQLLHPAPLVDPRTFLIDKDRIIDYILL